MESSKLISHFYKSFQNKDFKAMQECYADDASFSDAVFTDLNSDEVKAMWEMLCKRGKDLKIEFKILEADEFNVSAEWIAYYTFSATGNTVENFIKADFIIKDGKIISHHDDFDFYHWARQALGFKGLILGWTPLVQNKVRTTARKNLMDFMGSNSRRKELALG